MSRVNKVDVNHSGLREEWPWGGYCMPETQELLRSSKGLSHNFGLRTRSSLGRVGVGYFAGLAGHSDGSGAPAPEGRGRALLPVYFTDHCCLEQTMQPVTQPVISTKHKQLLSLATS